MITSFIEEKKMFSNTNHSLCEKVIAPLVAQANNQNKFIWSLCCVMEVRTDAIPVKSVNEDYKIITEQGERQAKTGSGQAIGQTV